MTQLRNLLLEAYIAFLAWSIGYLFIRRVLNPENEKGAIQKYAPDAFFGGAAAATTVFLKKILVNISPKCKSISLVSAYGVGESLKKSNVGIEIMNSWYLKDAYKAKNEQEIFLKSFNENIKKNIYRPKALSYGNTFLESTSRFDLASEILNNL